MERSFFLGNSGPIGDPMKGGKIWYKGLKEKGGKKKKSSFFLKVGGGGSGC